MLTIYSADVTGSPNNCSYPREHVISDEDSLRAAIRHDYVCIEHESNYHDNDNFIGSDCLPVDCDNGHSENPDDWVTPDDVMQAFPSVSFAIHYSRYNNREKNRKAVRPKFHVLFPAEYIPDVPLYSDMKELVNSIFPYLGTQTLDATRFFSGTTTADVSTYPGRMDLTELLNEDLFDGDLPDGQYDGSAIPEGSRNATMSRFAGRVVKKYGDCDKTYQTFMEESAKCTPPLEASELTAVWHSVQRFYARLSQQDGYTSPEVYNDPSRYKPGDYSDVGQTEVLAKYFSDEFRYSPATHFIRYSDHYWQESEPGAQAVAHEFTRRQLKEAGNNVLEVLDKLENSDAQSLPDSMSRSKTEQLMNEDQTEVYREFMAAKVYQQLVVKRRDSKNITSMLKESRPMLEISPRNLDADYFALCTPEAVYDLRKGMAGAREHLPEDFIIKITSISPNYKGQQIWLGCLDLIFQSNQELIDHVRTIYGLAAIGKVYAEALIIVYDDGRNGKPIFWNAISRVLGPYPGNISANTLTVGCRRNIKPEMAEVKSKRLLIATEVQEGARLNDSTARQFCFIDDVFAEKKCKDPFSLKPCHTFVPYTNHLPRVSASDDGIWGRLIVIPFNIKITGSNDIKNYSEYLYGNAGSSILAWVIGGARKVIESDYQIPMLECMQDVIGEYRSQNDWFGYSLSDKCEIDPSYKESSSSPYQAHRNYPLDCNEYVCSIADFYSVLEKTGSERTTMSRKRYFKGLRLRDDTDVDEDSMN